MKAVQYLERIGERLAVREDTVPTKGQGEVVSPALQALIDDV